MVSNKDHLYIEGMMAYVNTHNSGKNPYDGLSKRLLVVPVAQAISGGPEIPFATTRDC